MDHDSPYDDQPIHDAFARWVSLQAGAPRDAESLIEHVDVSRGPVGLLDTDVTGRRAVWKWASASARARLTAPTIAIEAVDPWSVDPASLRQRSDHVAVCDACGGEKKVRCAACAGSGKTLCGACRGQRKTYGYAANGAYRLLNCTLCKGRGETDCGGCRRGIVVCVTCAGEGRLQRWIEVESWSRSVSLVHPQGIALQFAWGERPSTETVKRDAELIADIERPHRITPADLERVPAEWLGVLAPQLMTGERIARQRLRIARVPTYGVHYRLGGDEDCLSLTGLRLLGPASAEGSAFGRRQSRLRSLLWLLLAIGSVIVLASLGRGLFFWSIPTFLSLIACNAALIAIYAAAMDWTAARRHTRRWPIAALSSLLIAIAFALVALPRAGHARQLVAQGALDAAESELNALGPKNAASAWADLRLARIRQATEIDEAHKILEEIPAELPQRAAATNALDQLILRTAGNAARIKQWSRASDALALLSQGGRVQPESAALATAVYVPLARQEVVDHDWSGAANALLAASRLGAASAELKPLTDGIRTAAVVLAAEANGERDAVKRLRLRLAAEETFVSWEQATENWGTPPLIALRRAMANDVVAAEREGQRRTR